MQRARKWLVRLALTAAAMELVWLAVANLLLSTALGPALLDRQLDESRVRWDGGRSWYPGHARVRGVVVEVSTWTTDAEIRVSEAVVRFRILPVLARRVVVRAADVYDVVLDVDYTPRDEPRPEPKKGPGFRFDVEGVEVHGVERVALNHIEVSGGAPVVRGSGTMQARGDAEVRELVVEWPDAHIRAGDESVAPQITLGFRGSVSRFSPGRVELRDVLAKISGAADVHGHSNDLRPLHLLLDSLAWIERLDGAGSIDAHVVLEEGRIQPGTDVDIVASDLQLWFLGFSAEGSGSVRMDAQGRGPDRRGTLEVAFDDFGFGRRGAPEPLARGSGFSFTATGRDLGLGRDREDFHAALDMPGTEIPDVARLVAGLPPALGIRLRGGSAKISGRLEAAGRDAEAKGELRIEATGLEGSFRDLDFRTDATLVSRIAGTDLDRFDLQLAGSELRLFNAAFEGPHIDPEDEWWMTVGVRDGFTHLRRPATVQAELDLSMRDSHALVAAFAEVKRWIHYFERLLSVRDVSGEATLLVRAPHLALREVSLTGHDFEALAELELHDRRVEGILFGKRGPFSLAMERIGDDNEFELTGSRTWYDEERARNWAKPSFRPPSHHP